MESLWIFLIKLLMIHNVFAATIITPTPSPAPSNAGWWEDDFLWTPGNSNDGSALDSWYTSQASGDLGGVSTCDVCFPNYDNSDTVHGWYASNENNQQYSIERTFACTMDATVEYELYIYFCVESGDNDEFYIDRLPGFSIDLGIQNENFVVTSRSVDVNNPANNLGSNGNQPGTTCSADIKYYYFNDSFITLANLNNVIALRNENLNGDNNAISWNNFRIRCIADFTQKPSFDQTADPTLDPTIDPTYDPTVDVANDVTGDPTVDPTVDPTTDPSKFATSDPTNNPTPSPTQLTTSSPITARPTQDATPFPTFLRTTLQPTTLDPCTNSPSTECCYNITSLLELVREEIALVREEISCTNEKAIDVNCDCDCDYYGNYYESESESKSKSKSKKSKASVGVINVNGMNAVDDGEDNDLFATFDKDKMIVALLLIVIILLLINMGLIICVSMCKQSRNASNFNFKYGKAKKKEEETDLDENI